MNTESNGTTVMRSETDLFIWIPMYWIIVGLFITSLTRLDMTPKAELATWIGQTGSLVTVLVMFRLVVLVANIRYFSTYVRDRNYGSLVKHAVIPVVFLGTLVYIGSTLTGQLSAEDFDTAWYGVNRYLLAFFVAMHVFDAKGLLRLYIWTKSVSISLQAIFFAVMNVLIPLIILCNYASNWSALSCNDCKHTWLSVNDLPGIVFVVSTLLICLLLMISGVKGIRQALSRSDQPEDVDQ